MMLLGGLVVLVFGAELLVRGAARLAALAGISPLVVGLTVVAYGTSAPELAVSVLSGLRGEPEIAVANVVGSNIFNVLLILGCCALVLPLVVSRQLVRTEVPLMIFVSLLAWWMLADGKVNRWDGAVLVGAAVGYTIWTIRRSRRETALAAEAVPQLSGDTAAGKRPAFGSLWLLVLVAAGLALLVLGSHWLVGGATALARTFGVSDVVIGLTIVAGGTSLPELATSLAAAFRGQRDMAIGNVVGSNLFNLMGILGVSSLVTPGGLVVAPSLANFDVPVMVAATVVCLPVFFTGYSISRLEGGLFLGGYIAYTAYLVLAATEHDALPRFSQVMLWYVLPAAGLLLTLSLIRALRARRAGHSDG